jgi:hypothetical protein
MLAVVTLVLGTTIATAQPLRVHPAAREIRAYRLTLENVAAFERIARALDKHHLPGSTRPDVALFIGLQGAWIGGEPWHDATVDDAVRLVEGGDPALRGAIGSAGLSTRDYVLTQMTLMLTHEAMSRGRRGSVSSMPADVSLENRAFVEAHWLEVDRVMTEFIRRIEAEVQRVAPR